MIVTLTLGTITIAAAGAFQLIEASHWRWMRRKIWRALHRQRVEQQEVWDRMHATARLGIGPSPYPKGYTGPRNPGHDERY